LMPYVFGLVQMEEQSVTEIFMCKHANTLARSRFIMIVGAVYMRIFESS
jgi:hypothetical protein